MSSNCSRGHCTCPKVRTDKICRPVCVKKTGCFRCICPTADINRIRKPVCVEKIKEPVTVEKINDPVTVEKIIDPVTVKKIIDPVTVEKINDPVTVTGCVGINNTVCVLSEKRLLPFVPASAKSSDCSTCPLVDIKDHPCAQHCYDFECNLIDSCGNVDGTFSGQAGGVNFAGPGGGVQNLGKFVCFTTTNEKKIALDAINVNPTGFSISLWFNAKDVTNVDSRFFSKTGALVGESHLIQSHVVSAQLLNKKLKFRLKLGNNPNQGTTQWQTVGNPINADTWFHAVFWYDGCNVRIYLNGVQQVIEETQEVASPGPNQAHAFSQVKGKPVFQGPQPSAAGSQPSNVGQFLGWRVFDGCMDQLIIWKNPISQKVIDSLYNSGDGSRQVAFTKNSSCANFRAPRPRRSCFLTLFKQVLCIKTCFEDKLCNVLCDGCGLLSLSVDGVDLVKDISLSEWPGSMDVLEIKGIDDKTFYSLRLCLDTDKLYRCPLKVDGKTVKLTITDGGFVETPLKPFIIAGFCRGNQGPCSLCRL